MKQYTIYFEIFGKKMKTTIQANSELDAKQKLKDKIVFHKVEEFDFIDSFRKIFGF